MSATISALYPPPQSIDSLDQWGSLDGLLWSLDDAVWTTCGVYGLTVGEDAQSADAMDGASVVYGAATGTATASGACEGDVIHDAGTMLGSAAATQSLVGNRVRTAGLDGSAEGDGSILGGCVVNGDQLGFAVGSGTLAAERIIYGAADGDAASSGMFAYALTMEFAGSGTATADAVILPEYKGWGWEQEQQGSETWTALNTSSAPWTVLPQGTAPWTQIQENPVNWQRQQASAQPWTSVI